MYNKVSWKRMRTVIRSIQNGATYQAASKAAGIDYATLWLWRKKWPRFGTIIQKIWDDNVKVVEDAHYSAAIRGNVIAQMNFLNNRARDRWQRMPDTVVQNNNQVTVANKIEYKDAPLISFVDIVPATPAPVPVTQDPVNRLENQVGAPSP